MFKIALTAGHYKYTAGKRCLKSLDPKETREWWLNDRIADKVVALLKDYTGYELLRTDDTTGEKDISMAARATPQPLCIRRCSGARVSETPSSVTVL